MHRIWKASRLAPHRIKIFKISNDPRFAEKLIAVVGLTKNPPDNAMVLLIDEKTRIQALDRTQAPLPAGAGHPKTRTHDYRRHGTTNPYAAFDILTGEVIGRLTMRARGTESLAFLKQVERQVPDRIDLHPIVDSSSTHGMPEVKAWARQASADHAPSHAHERETVKGGCRCRHRVIALDGNVHEGSAAERFEAASSHGIS